MSAEIIVGSVAYYVGVSNKYTKKIEIGHGVVLASELVQSPWFNENHCLWKQMYLNGNIPTIMEIHHFCRKKSNLIERHKF